jgi:hypothetical protein
MAMSGMRQTATNTAVNAGQQYANNAGNLMQNIGDSRASGIYGSTNTWMNGMNNLMQYRIQRGG